VRNVLRLVGRKEVVRGNILWCTKLAKPSSIISGTGGHGVNAGTFSSAYTLPTVQPVDLWFGLSSAGDSASSVSSAAGKDPIHCATPVRPIYSKKELRSRK
jgi:hypothetical protein